MRLFYFFAVCIFVCSSQGIDYTKSWSSDCSQQLSSNYVWKDEGCWVPPGIPSEYDVVLINVTGANILLSEGAALFSLTVAGGTLNVTGGFRTTGGDLEVSGKNYSVL